MFSCNKISFFVLVFCIIYSFFIGFSIIYAQPLDNEDLINPNEPSLLDPSKFLPHLKSTENLQQVLEGLEILSGVVASIATFILIGQILNLIYPRLIKILKNYPKFLKLIERIKKSRESMITPALILILYSSLVSIYGLSSILHALKIYQSIL